MKNSIKKFLVEILKNYKRFTNEVGVNAVFVLSTGRCGTETLSGLFNLSKNVECYHEPEPILFDLSSINYAYQKNAQHLIKEQFKKRRFKILKKAKYKNKIYIETSPQVTFLAQHLSEVVTKNKFIWLIRNPGDFIKSGLNRNYYNTDSYYDTWRIKPSADNEFFNHWKKWNQAEKIFWLWIETNQWISNFFTNVQEQKKIIVKSEDLYNGIDKTIKSLYEFTMATAPLQKEIDNVISKKLNSQKLISKTRLSKLSYKVDQDLLDYALPLLNKFGYNNPFNG